MFVVYTLHTFAPGGPLLAELLWEEKHTMRRKEMFAEKLEFGWGHWAQVKLRLNSINCAIFHKVYIQFTLNELVLFHLCSLTFTSIACLLITFLMSMI